MATAIRHQNAIGWFGLVTGRVSCYWTQFQSNFYVKQSILKPACRWTTAVIKQAFLIAWDMWEDRNGIKFSTTTAAAKRAMALVDAEIDELISVDISDIPRRDQPHLRMTARKRKKMTIEEKKRWIVKAQEIRGRRLRLTI